MLRFGFLLISLFLSSNVLGQNAELLWEPQFSYTWKQNDLITWNTKINTRNSVNEFDNSSFVEFIQPSISIIYAANPRLKLGIGYNYRYRQPSLSEQLYEHRLSQQLGFISFFGDRRISHRIRFEQRFRTESFQHRYRYRIGYDFPLTGSQLDNREQYLILKNELVNAITDSEYDAENRISIGIGWYYNPQRKFELGAEYRTKGLSRQADIQHVFMIKTTFYLNR